MARTSYVEIPSGFESLYKSGLSSADRFQTVSVRRKVLFATRRRKKGMTEKSLIALLTPVFNSFSDTVKANWTSAGAVSNMSGRNAFIKDTGLRIANGLSGYATPNDIYQALVGRLHVESPAIGLLIEQLHPSFYYVYKKIVGTKAQYNPVPVTENFSLPITLTLSYKTVLTSLGSGSFAKARIIVVSSYQGHDILTPLEIDLGLSTDWTRSDVTLSVVKGLVRGYTGQIEISNAVGDLYFDNVSFFHNGHNWARDPQCNSIDIAFTKAFAQIPKNWVAESISDGAFFNSFYYN